MRTLHNPLWFWLPGMMALVLQAPCKALETQPLNRLMMAQDTGGAIRGAVRADFYWDSSQRQAIWPVK